MLFRTACAVAATADAAAAAVTAAVSPAAAAAISAAFLTCRLYFYPAHVWLRYDIYISET